MACASFDPCGVEERLNALWKCCTEAVERLNVLRCEYERLQARLDRLDRLESEMLEAVSEVHARIDKIICRLHQGHDGPEDTDLLVGYLDSLD
eukprot:s2718_g6.t1